jgi:protein ImuB
MPSVSSRRYLSLWLRRLATDRLTRQSKLRVDRPLALVGPVKNARLLIAINDTAARLGLRVGMSFADACAICPALDWAETAPEEDTSLLIAIAEWCERYTPLVGIHSPDGLIFDITGVAHLFGGEAALARDLLTRLKAQAFHACIGIADTVGAAWAAARHGKTPIIPPGETEEALAPLPLSALRLAPEIRDGLVQLGLKTVGDIMARPRAPLATRFGAELMQRLDQAMGREEEPITPRLPVPPFSVEQGFPEPLLRDEDLTAVLARLTERLCASMEKRGQGARQMLASFFGVDGTVNRLQIGTSRPLHDAARLYRLFTDKFAHVQWDNEFGYDRIRLAALETGMLLPAQKDLSCGEDGPELAHLIDRLTVRLGATRVLRFLPQDSHVPEQESVVIPAASAEEFASSSTSPSWGGRRGEARRAEPGGWGEQSSQAHQDSLAPPRPLRLFERPEPIDVIAEVPDSPPVKFRWRRVAHDVARVEGPERIAMPWWCDGHHRAMTRDYFRVETRDGARLFLYREGLYDETAHPRWFLHGFLS